MTKKGAGEAQPGEMDAELKAIRSLVQVNQSNLVPKASARIAARAQPMRQTTPELTAPDRPKMLAPADTLADPSVDKSPSVAADLLRRAVAWAGYQIRTYRPIRKNILWTSLVLLLLLKPFMVIGWTITLLVTLGVVFFFLGADTFWRKVISMFQTYKVRRPEAARLLKLRAYVLAKKWDSVLNRLPDRMADVLRVPDLRELVKADARHDAALSDRLTRLRDDPLADF